VSVKIDLHVETEKLKNVIMEGMLVAISAKYLMHFYSRKPLIKELKVFSYEIMRLVKTELFKFGTEKTSACIN